MAGKACAKMNTQMTATHKTKTAAARANTIFIVISLNA